jgi:hypothetical protein
LRVIGTPSGFRAVLAAKAQVLQSRSDEQWNIPQASPIASVVNRLFCAAGRINSATSLNAPFRFVPLAANPARFVQKVADILQDVFASPD